MKDYFEDFGKKLTETADTIVGKTSQAVEVQKLKSKVRTQERRIEKDMQNLGGIIYEKFVSGEIVDGDFADLCKDISESKEVIQGLEKEIQEVQDREV
jgi:hypothetical protein